MKNLFWIALVFIGFETLAQQGLQMEFTKLDSVQMRAQRQLEYYQLVSGNTGLMDLDIALPEINLQEEYRQRYTLNLNLVSFGNYGYTGMSAGSMHSFYSPYFMNASIMSSAAYQLSDKFTVGGFSYGANSLHNPQIPFNTNNNFDAYGSTLFMEYKVSKKFKIETRVNIQQGGHHPGF